MIKVLLSLDLIKSEDKRDDFYDFLKSKKWQKTNDVDTVWTIRYGKLNPADDDAYKKVKKNIKATLIEASKELKLTRIEYVALLGNSDFIARAVKKDNGEYQQFTRPLYPKK